MLDVIKSGNGHVIVDGVKETRMPLKLSIIAEDNQGNAVELAKVRLPLSIKKIFDPTNPSGPNNFFRWINLRPVVGEQPIRETDISQPINWRDSETNTKHVVVVHGFNVDESGSTAWGAEFFKRLFWSGSRAKMTMVSWQGKPPGGAANYYKAVWNAFISAPVLKSEADKLEGDLTVSAHSLGNILVSSAINDYEFRPKVYNLLDAAVPVEAYGPAASAYFDKSLSRPGEWKLLVTNIPEWHLYPEDAHASRWYTLWPVSDARYKLGWAGRFSDISSSMVKLYNYYSGDEEVLRNAAYGRESAVGMYEQAWEAGVNNGQYAWIAQEWNKSNFDRNFVTNSNDVGFAGGGWRPQEYWIYGNNNEWSISMMNGYNYQVICMDKETFSNFTSEQKRFRTVFTHFENEAYHTAPVGGISLPSENAPQSRAHMLACQVPPATNPAGNNPLPDKYNFINYQMDDGVDKSGNDLQNPTPSSSNRAGWDFLIAQKGFKDGWIYRDDVLQSRWLHSDAKDVAYKFNHKIYDRIVGDSDLKQKP